MRRKAFWWLLALGILALGLGACNQTSTSGGDSGDSGGAVAYENVISDLQGANSILVGLMGGLGVPAPALIFPADASEVTWNCSESGASGDLTDADDDGIPRSATLNGECTLTTSEGTFTWKWQDLSIKDPDDSDPEGGIEVSGRVVYEFASSDGVTFSLTWTIETHRVVKGEAEGVYDYTIKGSWEARAGDEAYTVNYDLSGTWEPNADDTGGHLVIEEGSSMSGSGPGCDSGWEVDISADLVYAECGIQSGSANVSGHDCDGNEGSCQFTWSDCSSTSNCSDSE